MPALSTIVPVLRAQQLVAVKQAICKIEHVYSTELPETEKLARSLAPIFCRAAGQLTGVYPSRENVLLSTCPLFHWLPFMHFPVAEIRSMQLTKPDANPPLRHGCRRLPLHCMVITQI